jgi:ATP-dependent helicase/nuclease subunit B
MQLGLLGLIAEMGGFEGIEGAASGFEYWSLAKSDGRFGRVRSIAAMKDIDADTFVVEAERQLREAIGRWLLGSEPFTAKLHPEYAPYGDYDQLMRLEEWYGRGEA